MIPLEIEPMRTKITLIGAPKGFSLRKSIHAALSINVAMAFATRGGWNIIQPPGTKQLEKTVLTKIVVGSTNAITDPNLLSDWLREARESPATFQVSLAPRKPMFHPKVFIIENSDKTKFAIVGSGNLTPGGQQENIECGFFIQDTDAVQQLERWFLELDATPLNQEILDNYRAWHKKVRRASAPPVPPPKFLDRLLNGESDRPRQNENQSWEKQRFIKDLTAYLRSKDGEAAYQGRIVGAENIRKLLRIPNFSFDKTSWDDFKRITEFGWIRPAYDQSPGQMNSLRKSLRLLITGTLTVEKLDSILSPQGSGHVRGVGRNLITKILTVCDEREWPVINARVEETMCQYGYQCRPGASGYLQFANEMRAINVTTGGRNFWAFDAFWEWKSRD